MKRLLQLLVKFKWTLVFPFASLVIWFVGFLASSMERFLPVILNQVLSFWHFTGRENYSVDTLVNNIGFFVNGVDAWFPVYIFISYVFLILAWRFSFMAVRFFVKLITVGQI